MLPLELFLKVRRRTVVDHRYAQQEIITISPLMPTKNHAARYDDVDPWWIGAPPRLGARSEWHDIL